MNQWRRSQTKQKLIVGFIPPSNFCRRQRQLATSVNTLRTNGGVDRRTTERYLAKAREIIRADYSVERSDFLGTRLALLDEIIEASIRCKQHSNAVGALKLQAQLTRLLEGS